MAGNGFEFGQDLSFRLSNLKFTIDEFEKKNVLFRIEIYYSTVVTLKLLLRSHYKCAELRVTSFIVRSRIFFF